MASSEAEGTVTPNSPIHESNPEPRPEWQTAFRLWNSWWDIHNYAFGCFFTVLAIFCVFCLIRLRVSQNLTLERYFAAVSALLLVFTTTRALFLLLDPYEAHKHLSLPVVVVRILFALGYPCLTSVFSLINFAFVKVNNLQIILKRLQNIKFLTIVILVHFLVVLTVYLVVTFAPQLAKLFIICQSILIVWWILLTVCFVYSACLVVWNRKIKSKYINNTSKIQDFEVTESGNTRDKSNSCGTGTAKAENSGNSRGTRRLVRISSVVAIAGLISVALEFYSLFGVYKLYSLEDSFVKPWPWWYYQTGSRAVEVCLCSIVAYVVFPTIRRRHSYHSTNIVSSQTTTGNRIFRDPNGEL